MYCIVNIALELAKQVLTCHPPWFKPLSIEPSYATISSQIMFSGHWKLSGHLNILTKRWYRFPFCVPLFQYLLNIVYHSEPLIYLSLCFIYTIDTHCFLSINQRFLSVIVYTLITKISGVNIKVLRYIASYIR